MRASCRRTPPAADRRPLATAVLLGSALLAVECGGAPWFLGAPLDEKNSIPATTRSETVADHRRKLAAAHERGEKVIELSELDALERRGALHAPDRARFIELLRERARDWAALGRPVPLAQDLRHLVALDPGRGRALSAALRTAQRAAGDFWLALGEHGRAEEEYRRAERLGADRMSFRLRAAWEATPADLDRETLERALLELPERALAPFTVAYLGEGGAEPRALRRAWGAARVYGPPELRARLGALPGSDAFTQAVAPARAPSGRPSAALVAPPPDDRLLRGPTLARVLLPLCAAFPDLTRPGERSRAWAEWLVAEDPTSADGLELAALIDARAGRVDAAARKLGDLVYYSADRANGYTRAARVWERAGLDRRACVAWKRAALLAPVDDSRWCDLQACLRRDPGAGDAEETARYVARRAPSLSCNANTPDAADGGVLEAGTPISGPPSPGDGGAADSVPTRPDGGFSDALVSRPRI